MLHFILVKFVCTSLQYEYREGIDFLISPRPFELSNFMAVPNSILCEHFGTIDLDQTRPVLTLQVLSKLGAFSNCYKITL